MPSDARCGRHPDAPAVDVCGRCGAFLCAACEELLGERVLCPDCFQRLGGGAPASLRAKAGPALGILGLLAIPSRELFFRAPLLCAGLGLIGFALSWSELRRIQAGRSPVVGRNFAKVGLILGWINFGFIFLALLSLATWFYMRSGLGPP